MKNAAGGGSIRKKTVLRNGKEYTYWEARYTSGRDPATGKQLQHSVSGKTQQEVRKKLAAATAAIDAGTYQEPSRITLAQWLEIWQKDFLKKQKERTRQQYESSIRVHIIPELGAVRLDRLTTLQIQSFYSGLDLSPKSIHNVHGVLHKALNQAVDAGVLAKNPANGCELPKVGDADIHPLEPEQLAVFLDAIKGDRFENLLTVAVFSGMREGELIGLPWRNVNLKRGTITVSQQIQRVKGVDLVTTPKHDRVRTLTVAPVVMDAILAEPQVPKADNEYGLVFTDPTGKPISARTLTQHFKKILQKAGLPEIRVHDLRHTYAVNSLLAGDDIKTIQHNLGHATAAFTLDIYEHYTQQMRHDSASRMQAFAESVKGKIRENASMDGNCILQFPNKKAE